VLFVTRKGILKASPSVAVTVGTNGTMLKLSAKAAGTEMHIRITATVKEATTEAIWFRVALLSACIFMKTSRKT
jgi:hypothetical protein